jgi:pteridine reductase
MATAKVALITGAAKRVGRAIALKLAREGFDVVFTYRGSQAEARDLEEEIKILKRQCLAIQSDFTNPPRAADEVFTSFSKRFSRLDALVNNASLYQPSSLHPPLPSRFTIFSRFTFTRPSCWAAALKPLLRQSRGHIVNMIDLLAERPWPEYLATAPAKPPSPR